MVSNGIRPKKRSCKTDLSSIELYLKCRKKDISDKTLDYMRKCKECLEELVFLRKKLNYRSKRKMFEKYQILQHRIEYNNGTLYSDVRKLLWDEELMGRTFEESEILNKKKILRIKRESELERKLQEQNLLPKDENS